jgi:N-acetylglucosamine-6-phosphate deacetylase
MNSLSPSEKTPFNRKHTLLTDALVLTPEGLRSKQTVHIKGATIEAVSAAPPSSLLLREDDVQLIPLNDNFMITPGLIDLQINGGLGCDFNTSSIPVIQQFLAALPRFGVTGILPTLITAPHMDMVTATNTFEELLHLNRYSHAKVLGLHLEGPFLNTAKRGAHPANAITPPDMEMLQLLLSPQVKMMTLAPECDTEFLALDYLRQQGIITFAGHTKATADQLKQAMVHGLSGVTHLFNAMDGFTHRETGTALHSLNIKTLKASFIADGYHVHPDMLRLALETKGIRNMLLVSDAMNLAGLGDGAKGFFGNQSIQVEAGRAINQEGNLAGSTQFMDSMVRNLLNWNLASVEACFEMGATNPAKLLGLENSIGAIAAGYQADMVLWHRPTMQVLATWVAGQLLWCDPKLMGVAGVAPTTETAQPAQQQQTAFPSPPAEAVAVRATKSATTPSSPQGFNPHSTSNKTRIGALPKAFAPSQHIGLI